MTDNTTLIDQMQDNLAGLREALEDFAQWDMKSGLSDEANEQNIMQATAALDALEGHVGDLIP